MIRIVMSYEYFVWMAWRMYETARHQNNCAPRGSAGKRNYAHPTPFSFQFCPTAHCSNSERHIKWFYFYSSFAPWSWDKSRFGPQRVNGASSGRKSEIRRTIRNIYDTQCCSITCLSVFDDLWHVHHLDVYAEIKCLFVDKIIMRIIGI